MTLNEAIIKMSELTDQNVRLLQDINRAFTDNKSYIVTNIAGVDYNIPSFALLESKINHLQWSFDNLVKSPQHGEAWFNYDGSSRSIEVRGYQQAPPRLNHHDIKVFGVEQFNGFKDMMTPRPVIRFDLSSLPDDTRRINVRKVVIFDGEGLISNERSKVIPYSIIKEMMSNVTSNNKFSVYDTVMELPFKKSTGYGKYTIKEIRSETLHPEQRSELVIKGDLTYINSNYDIAPLQIGDRLTTWDSSAMMTIVGMDRSDNSITVEVASGEYTNFVPMDEKNPTDYSILRFYEPVNFKADKYIDIPLEEDRYVYISIAPINEKMGIHSLWSDGLLVDTHMLTDHRGVPFKRYYDENVKNIGDILQEIVSIAPAAITRFSPDEYSKIRSFKIKEGDIHYSIHRSNDHMINPGAAAKIEDLKIKLDAKFKELEGADEEKSEKIKGEIENIKTDIKKILETENLPMTDIEYGIYTWVDISTIFNSNIKVLPRDLSHIEYKWARKAIGSDDIKMVTTLSPTPYKHSPWNYGECRPNDIDVSYENGIYNVKFVEKANDVEDNKNNGFIIPILPGEEITFQVRCAWRFGQPYTNIKSEWSDPINVVIPNDILPTKNYLHMMDAFDGYISNVLNSMEDFKDVMKELKKVDDINAIVAKAKEMDKSLSEMIETKSNELNDLNKRIEDLDGLIRQKQGSTFIVPTVSYGDTIIRPGETVELGIGGGITINVKGGLSFYHNIDSDVVVNNKYQDPSGVLILDEVYGQKLSKDFAVNISMNTDKAHSNPAHTIKTLDLKNGIDIKFTKSNIDNKIGISEYAISVKYDPSKDPLTYIIRLKND